MRLYVFILLSLIGFICPLFSSTEENPTLKRILEFHKRKDYKEIRKLTNEYIKNQENLNQDDKVIKFYFHTENDVQKLDSILDSIYKNTKELSPKFFSLNYILMEKALLRNQYDVGVKWGEIFRKEAKSKKQKYIRGLYVYSCLLYKANRASTSLLVIESALREKPSKKITSKLQLLRISQLKNDFQIIVESKIFLKDNYDSTYADFIFATMIQSYRNKGKKKKVEQLKAEFIKNFGDSILADKVIGI